MKREVRIYKGSEVRAKKGENQIEGHAAIFNSLSQNLGGYFERVMPGAFTDDLKTSPDVRCLFNHDPNMILGRTTSRTLKLSEDDKGLAYVCDLPDTQVARDLQTSIDRGDISQCSWGFYVTSQKWSQEPDPDDATGKSTVLVREIHKCSSFDVSPVTFPAYTGTDVDTRSLFPDGIPGDVRAHVPGLDRRKTKREKTSTAAELEEERKRAQKRAECACDCAECSDDNCADCTMDDDCADENCMHDDEPESMDRTARLAKRAANKAADKSTNVIAIDNEADWKRRAKAKLAAAEE